MGEQMKLDRSHKDEGRALLDQMPDDVSMETIVAELTLKLKVIRGLEQLHAGQTLTHEEVQQRPASWRRSAGP